MVARAVAVLAVPLLLGLGLPACGGDGEKPTKRVEGTAGPPELIVVAGTGTEGLAGEGGPATEAELSGPSALAWDDQGNLYIGQIGSRISMVDAESGLLTTVAGTGESGSSGDGGPATEAEIGDVWELAFDGDGNLYFTDIAFNTIRRIDTGGVITTVAGAPSGPSPAPDGTPAVKASLSFPAGLAVDGKDRLYFSDGNNHLVRRIEPDGTITTVAGTGESGESGDGGPATDAQLLGPRGLEFDEAGNLYIGTHDGSRFRVVDPS